MVGSLGPHRLEAGLKRAGADYVELSINHPAPHLHQSQWVGFGVAYQGARRLDEFPDITLQRGFEQPRIVRLAVVAFAIILLPLVLLAVRARGRLSTLAGAPGRRVGNKALVVSV